MTQADRDSLEGNEEQVVATWIASLRERREVAGFTQAELARRAGVSEGTIKRIESGKEVSRDTLLRLVGVPELRLHEMVPPGPLGVEEAEPSFLPNCWIAPGFNALDLTQEMIRELNGQGGHIDQTHLYLDPISATGWHDFATDEAYLPGRVAMPLEPAAGAILDSIHGAGLDVIALGPGDGRDEVRMVVHLLDDPRHRDLRLFLLDISQPLLSAALEYATDALADREWVSVTAIQGNFHHLPRYRHLLHGPRRSHRRRLVTMLGGTFTNLLNESLFIRSSLGGFGPGDLVLFNAAPICAPADRPDEIRQNDRLLSSVETQRSSRILGALHTWMSGPLRRYVRGMKGVSVTTDLDLSSCPVPGSYAVVHRAMVTLESGETRAFSALYMKRYDEEKLVEYFGREGWDSVARWHYGTGRPSVLYLFRKR